MENNRFNLPLNHKPYQDKYFLRAKEILQAEGINPWVRAQVMIRKGPGNAYGIDEALAILDKYSNLVEHGGRVYALKEGAKYEPKDTVMLIEAPIQDIIDLETMYLGVIAAETTKANDKRGIDLNKVKENTAKVYEAAKHRMVSYFGARHWRYDEDPAITFAAFHGGARSASTDAGAATFGAFGMGTTPHVLENIMAWKYGYENAVVETMKAFDKNMHQDIARVILCDYRNKEITDALRTAQALEGRLNGVRIDTCGENVGEGALEFNDPKALEALTGKTIDVPKEDEKYWFGHGVTVSGVYAMRKALDKNDFKYVNLVLSSGFANPQKVAAFARAEDLLGVKLFDSLGVGQVFESRASKMDIVAVGETPQKFVPISKAGRGYNPNPNLELRLGNEMKGGHR
jgi:nicotinate phosphoribosyltransferase